MWVYGQPFGPPILPVDIQVRMTAFQMADGGIWIHSPIAPTAELLAMLEDLPGPIKHVVIPSIFPEHWIYAYDFCQLFPDAMVWMPQSVLDRRRTAAVFGALGAKALQKIQKELQPLLLHNQAPAAWGGEIQISILDTPVLTEATFCIKPHRAVLASDMGFQLADPDAFYGNRVTKPILMAGGAIAKVHRRLGAPVPFLLGQLNRKELQAWAEDMLGWEYDKIISGHLDTVVYDEDHQKLRQAFSFVLKRDS